MTVSCHALSSVPAAAGKRCVTGIGAGSPSRRATATATASTADESRPPEKLTRQGERRSAGRMAASSSARGVVPGASRGSVGSLPCRSSTSPEAISRGVSGRGGSQRVGAGRRRISSKVPGGPSGIVSSHA